MQVIHFQPQGDDSMAEKSGGTGTSIGAPEPTETQEVDILVSQQWLHHRMWDLCLKHTLLSAGDMRSEFRPDYIVVIAQDMLQICTTSRLSSMEVHGVGIVSNPLPSSFPHYLLRMDMY